MRGRSLAADQPAKEVGYKSRSFDGLINAPEAVSRDCERLVAGSFAECYVMTSPSFLWLPLQSLHAGSKLKLAPCVAVLGNVL